jgi:hypothetical protein
MAEPHEKLATQVDPVVLDGIRNLARQEGSQLQALVEEALVDFVEKRKSTHSRPNLIAEYYAHRDQCLALKFEALKILHPANANGWGIGVNDPGTRPGHDAANE